jgi:hypothetical protein
MHAQGAIAAGRRYPVPDRGPVPDLNGYQEPELFLHVTCKSVSSVR